MKKLISVFMSIIIALAIFSYTDFISFALNQTEDIERTRLGATDTYYSFDAKTKTLTISGVGDTPSNFENDNASQPWYRWRSDGSIEHVVVEHGITSLGKYLFYGIKALDFSLPSTLRSIGSYAMGSLSLVKNINLPQSIVTISNHAFYFSTSVENVNIPSAVNEIGDEAFANCLSLKNLTFDNPYAQISIGKKAFFYCSSLKTVTIPKQAKLGSYSFAFYSASKGSVYKDFIMNIYRDSPAYSYAVNNNVGYSLINKSVINSEQTINCSYYENSYQDKMIFEFTAPKSHYYKFYSSGLVDVDCILTDSLDTSGEILAQNKDISPDDLNFAINYFLEAGKTYYYTVSCFSHTSVGDFSVTMICNHNYESVVTPPTLSADGYTTYTCTYCGESIKSDFVKRTGVMIRGKLVLMESPDGSHPNNYPVSDVFISVDGKSITVSGEDGGFEIYVPASSKQLRIYSDFSAAREFEIFFDENLDMRLDDIVYFNLDYYKDGYVNAKDFAVIRKLYGKYPQSQEFLYRSVDYNRDGVIDYDDFKFAKSFFTYGKITESIYD